MSLFEVGRLAVKIAGRDAGKTCVILDSLEEGFVLIDGQTRRRKCNHKHLELLDKVIKIKKNASHEEVKVEFKILNLEALDTKPKNKTEKPKKQRLERLKAKKKEVSQEKTLKAKPEEPKPKLETKEDLKETPEKQEKEMSSFEKTLEKENPPEEKKETTEEKKND